MPSTSDAAQQAQEPQQGEPQRRSITRWLRSRSGWAVAAVAGAFLAAAGGGIYALTVDAGKTVKQRVFSSPSAPITVQVFEPGTFAPGHVWAPYYIVPTDRLPDPSALPKEEQSNDQIFFDYAWSQRRGAVAGSPQIVRLRIRGKSDEPVTISKVGAQVVAKKSAVEGWYVATPGCGAEPVRIALVDLDASPPKVEYETQTGLKKDLALSVTQTDVELIELHVSTGAMADWRAEVFYSASEGNGSLAVDDQGHPFRVSSEKKSAGYTFDFASSSPKLKREHAWDGEGIFAC